MSEPRTEAGRTLIAAWRHVSVPWMEQRVGDIEAEVREDLARQVRHGVVADDYDPDPTPVYRAGFEAAVRGVLTILQAPDPLEAEDAK